MGGPTRILRHCWSLRQAAPPSEALPTLVETPTLSRTIRGRKANTFSSFFFQQASKLSTAATGSRLFRPTSIESPLVIRLSSGGTSTF